jgi:hypothetical protein
MGPRGPKEKHMYKFITCAMLAIATAGFVGCEASAEVDDDGDGDYKSTKTTTVDRDDDGDSKTTRTETKVDR